MMKFFTAYKVRFTRAELGLKDGDMMGNPLLTNRKLNLRYKMGSHISEEGDEFYSTNRKQPS